MKGIIGLYYGFRKHLLKDRKKLAVLQCLGRLEEYMTKEFASFIYLQSDRSILPLTNLGRKGEQKIDIALLEGDFSEAISTDNAKITTFVVVKFLRNLHRVGPGKAEDEIGVTLTDLRRQLCQFDKPEHAGYGVELRGRRKDIYGLVLTSYVRTGDGQNDQRGFLKKITDCASELGFQYHDLPKPALREVYCDQRAMILLREMRASLLVGLWRLKSQ